MSKVYNMVGLGSPLDDLSAKAEDVVVNKKFVGAHGETETGSMPVVSAKTTVLDAFSPSHTIEYGKHSGSGVVKVNTQEKRVTPTAQQQTVYADRGYLMSRVIVESAAHLGKQVYTGEFTPYDYGTSPEIDVGVTLDESDLFFFLLKPDEDRLDDITAAASLAVRLSPYDGFYWGSESTPDGTSYYITETGSVSVVYAGSTVTVGNVWYSGGYTYRWILIK